MFQISEKKPPDCVMTDTFCAPLPAPLTAAQRHTHQLKLWKRYSKSRAGEKTENYLIEEYIPLVKHVVGQLAVTLPAHVNINSIEMMPTCQGFSPFTIKRNQ